MKSEAQRQSYESTDARVVVTSSPYKSLLESSKVASNKPERGKVAAVLSTQSLWPTVKSQH